MKKFKQLTNKEFALTKTLMEMGLNGKKLEDVTNRTSSTLSYIRHAKTFDDYKKFVTYHSARQKLKKSSIKPELEEPVKTDDLVTIVTDLVKTAKEINETLGRIDKLYEQVNAPNPENIPF